MSEAFGGIFKDLRAFKDEIASVEKNLKDISDGFPLHMAKIEQQVSEVTLKMTEKFSAIEYQIQETQKRVTQEGLVAETGVEIGGNNGIESIESKDLPLSRRDAQNAIVDISERWSTLIESLRSGPVNLLARALAV